MNSLDGYEAVVYDLDGTLVNLVVDWQAVASELATRLRRAGVDPDGLTSWELLDAGEDAGIGEELEALIASHERTGARRSEPLALASGLPEIDVPVAVCSLNCEAACTIALERHDVATYVETVIGRDSVPTRKPAPEPLLAALDPLGVNPNEAVFVGDSERDAVTAERAGTAFQWVEEG